MAASTTSSVLGLLIIVRLIKGRERILFLVKSKSTGLWSKILICWFSLILHPLKRGKSSSYTKKKSKRDLFDLAPVGIKVKSLRVGCRARKGSVSLCELQIFLSQPDLTRLGGFLMFLMSMLSAAGNVV
jgi:hypothetical protein